MIPFNVSEEELAQRYLIPPAPTEELPKDERRRLGAAARTSYRRKLDREQHEAEAATVDFTDGDPFGVSPRMAPWLKAFNTVAVNYFEFRNASPMPVQDYGKLLDDTAGPINGTLAQRPNAQDFIADVEYVSRHALRGVPALLRLFNLVVLNEAGARWCRVPLKVQAAIAQRVGAAFISAGLVPSKYFRVIRRKAK